MAVGYQDEDLKMPPKQRLTPQQVKDLTDWVKFGAPIPEAGASVAPVRKEFQITDKDRAHWAFQPVKSPQLPNGKANPIDALIVPKLSAAKLVPIPPASPRELVRRAYYDLTELPPSPAEIDAFMADKSPKAWERLIDRLLASPRYGEKWVRHWLALVRFAES